MDQITTSPIVIGIDAGGTMTDTILVDQGGHFKIGKSATTPKNEAEGFIASAEDAANAWGISLSKNSKYLRFSTASTATWSDEDLCQPSRN